MDDWIDKFEICAQEFEQQGSLDGVYSLARTRQCMDYIQARKAGDSHLRELYQTIFLLSRAQEWVLRALGMLEFIEISLGPVQAISQRRVQE